MINSILSGPWPRGVNSLLDPQFTPEDQVIWSVNTINRGGAYQTRPGYTLIPDTATGYTPPPRGMTIFSPRNQEPFLVVAVGSIIRVSEYPFTSWRTLGGINLGDGVGPVYFETAIKGAVTSDGGTRSVIDPYPVLMIQTGETRAAFWDGTRAAHLSPIKPTDPDKPGSLNETPIGTWMKWIGSRLWVAQGSRIRVSNILDPLKFTEEKLDSEGGALSIPDVCTGLGVTSDLQSLLAFTVSSTTSFQAGVMQRAPDPLTGAGGWINTPNFQSILFPDIGCVAGKTILNQYGLTWWLSQGGLVSLDGALAAYRTSKLHFKDNNMSRSKSNLSPDVSGACAGAYENFLLLSMPSGDTYNSHTWVMDQSILDDLSSEAVPAWASCWTGTRPVQWVSRNLKGKNRCFQLSRDHPPDGGSREFRSGVWESFCPSKVDFGQTQADQMAIKAISCSLETKFLSKDASYGEFDHFRTKLRELGGSVHLDGYYASTHSGYKQVLSKDMVATIDTYNADQADVSGNAPLVRQARTIKSGEDRAQSLDLDAGVEDIYNRNKDTSFSILLKWVGQLAISYLILYTRPSGEQTDGRVEIDETTVRKVTAGGPSEITTFLPRAQTMVSGLLQSGNINVSSSRVREDFYKSMS